MSTQFTSPRISAVVDVILRWFLVLALLLAIGLRHQVAVAILPPPYFSDLGRADPGCAHHHDARHAGTHAAFCDERVRCSQRHHRGLQQHQSGTRAALEQKPGHGPRGRRLFRRPQQRPPRCGIRLAAHRRTERPRPVREATSHRRHLHCAAHSTFDARDEFTGRSSRYDGIHLLRARHLRVRPDPSALRRDSRHSGRGHVRNAVLRLPRCRQAPDRHRAVGRSSCCCYCRSSC